MKGKLYLASAAAAILLSGSFLIAAEDSAPTTQPMAHHMGGGKLIKPYSEMTDLTEDQTAQIEDIHKKTLAEQKTLLAKERSDIEALLTDKQKEELKDLSPAGKKMSKGKKKKGGDSPTTAPTE